MFCYIWPGLKAPAYTLTHFTARKNKQAQIQFRLRTPKASRAKLSLVVHNTHFVTRDAHKFQQPESPRWQQRQHLGETGEGLRKQPCTQ